MLSIEKFIERANCFGKNNCPFFFILDFELQKPILVPLYELNDQAIKYEINGVSNTSFTPIILPSPILLESHPIAFDVYKRSFDAVKKNILLGNSFLVNLTCESPITLNISLQEVFFRTKAKYKVYLRDDFVCFSPETFVQIDEQGKIYAFPMKGTIDASQPNAKQALLNDPKEEAEHATIVDLIRNDLSMIAKNVSIEEFRYLEPVVRYNQTDLLQVSSKISGNLPTNWKDTIGSIMAKLLPAGSVSGAPKAKTIEIIQTTEKQMGINYRGYYSGIVGIFNGKTLDSGVLIRYIEHTPKGLIFRSGGGITARSSALAEYNEMKQKIYVPIV